MSRDARNSPTGGDATVRERVEELTWALVDRNISDDECSLLDTLLLSDDSARDTYLGCMQLHTDLMFHYAEKNANATGGGKSPVLGFLGDALPPTGAQPPVAEHN